MPEKIGMNRSWTSTVLLLGVVTLSLILNLTNIRFGLPYVYGRNVEGRIVTIAVNAFATGDLNPHVAIYPHLQLYILLAAFVPFYLWGRLTGAMTSRGDLLSTFGIDPTPLYAISRCVTAAFGTGCVVMVYLIARRLYGKSAALLASFLTACAPLLVTNAHMVTPDVIMSFFILVSFYYAIRIWDEGRFFDYFMSGAMLGLGFTAKYPAAVAGVFILCAHLLRRQRNDGPPDSEWGRSPAVLSVALGIALSGLALILDPSPLVSPIKRHFPVDPEKVALCTRALGALVGCILIALPYLSRKVRLIGNFLSRHRLLLVAVAASAIFIFIGSPYLLLDISMTINSLLYHALTESGPFWGTEETPAGWIYYLVLLKEGTSLPFTLLFITGAVLLLHRHRREDLLILSFPLVYYAFMGSFETKFPRYILPIVPFLAIFSVSILDTLNATVRRIGGHRGRNALVTALSLVAIPSLVTSIQWDRKMGMTDTRTVAKEWIEENIPPGSRIATEALGPPLRESDYDLYVFHRGELRELRGLDPWAHYRLGEVKGAKKLVDAGIEYVVVNSNTYRNYFRVPNLYPEGYAFYVVLDSLFRRIKTFQPGNGPGPVVKIYSLRGVNPLIFHDSPVQFNPSTEGMK